MDILLNNYPHPLHSVIIIAHILAGVVGLISAPIALAVTRGGPAHVRAGRFFHIAMLAVFATTVMLAFFRFSLFLFAIGVVSGWSSWTGVRASVNRRRGTPATALDWVMTLTVLGYGAALLLSAAGASLLPAGLMPAGAGTILSAIFGLAICAAAASQIQAYVARNPDPKAWLRVHINQMMSAYLSAITAFAVNVGARFVPGEYAWLLWLAPGVIGGVFVGRMLKRHAPRNVAPSFA